ncbi:MAG: DUF3990 domain-containing protein [Clostridiales bacterium]|nr:DUF3990 domain-containing protein [Clostridiales bacterium]
MRNITIYHGSQNIIEKPEFGLGKKHNDFGLGFYCTQNEELAKEWAVSYLKDGFLNKYTLDLDYLKVLNLNTPEYSILNWIAILLEHRLFSIKTPIARRAKQYIIDNYSINVNAYDVIIGYRADDSYFDYAESFVNNEITIDQLAKAMQLGKLGEQIVLKSQYAFANLKFEGFEIAEKAEYYSAKVLRDETAKQQYLEILDEEDDGLTIRDITRGDIKNDDSRIPRNIPN